MVCPVCGDTETTVVNVRVSQENELRQLAGSTWDGRNVARCNGCGVLYDHRYAADGDESDQAEAADETVNCSECGTPNPGTEDACSYCGAPLRS